MLLTVAGVLAVGAGAVAATGIGFPADRSDRPRSVAPPATAKVTRQTLVDTQKQTGTLSYGDSTTLNGRLAGTVTTLPAAGSVIGRGKELYRVDNVPVLLLYGSLPTYRALASGVEGADVKQFEQNLWDLGYRGFTVDEKYTDATATAVKKWQKAVGLPQNGTVEVGRVAYASGPVRVDTVKAHVTDAAKPGDVVLTYTGTVRGVTAELNLADRRLAGANAAVSVGLPDGRTATGKVTGTRTKVDESSGSGSNGSTGGGNGGDGSTATTKLVVTVAFDDPNASAGLDQASVEVAFTADKREQVLTVPVSALLTLAEGGYGVQLIEGAGTRVIAVTTGMFASGRVEVSGAGLAEGTTVGMPT